MRLPVGAGVVVGSAGAVIYRSRVRRTSRLLPAGTHGRVTEAIAGFRVIASGAGNPPLRGCHLEPERCRASHVHSFLVHSSALEPVP